MTVAGFGVAGGPRAVHFLRPLQPVHQEPHIAGPRRLQVQFIWIPVSLPPVCVWMGAAPVPGLPGLCPCPSALLEGGRSACPVSLLCCSRGTEGRRRSPAS